MENRQSTILVVDDNRTNLKLVTDVLGFEGYCILTATDAKQAQAVVRQSPPDLILMDIGLPDMDGLALTQILKADQKTCHIIIVALTAFAMKGDEEKAIAAGCDGYIIKPIDTRKFPRLVAELLLRGIVSGQSKPAPIIETKA
ncbi:MAG TPA: response regulator [Chthoniobacterales bacterium]|jgi:CheY-like chemotaxis protein|nr:response regulator [Chthoniobacterales bacterium]